MTSTSPRLRTLTRLADVDALVRRFSSSTATSTAAPGGYTSSVPMAGVAEGAAVGGMLGLAAGDGPGASDAALEGGAVSGAAPLGEADGAVEHAPRQAARTTAISGRMFAPGRMTCPRYTPSAE